jgi:hypothetical protein
MNPVDVTAWPGVYFDHSGDDRASALDALRVINELARQRVLAEGETNVDNQQLRTAVPGPLPVSQSRLESTSMPPRWTESVLRRRQLLGDAAVEDTRIVRTDEGGTGKDEGERQSVDDGRQKDDDAGINEKL